MNNEWVTLMFSPDVHLHDQILGIAALLNIALFEDRPLDDDAITAMLGMGLNATFVLYGEIVVMTAKSVKIRSPYGLVKHRARTAGFVPAGGGAQHYGASSNSSVSETPPLASLPRFWRCAGVRGCGMYNTYSMWECRRCRRLSGT
jgi:hypothetical protein